jgi:translation initiation factor IF-1
MRDRMEVSGEVIDHCKDIFKIRIDGGEQIVTAKLSGKMRQNKINLQVGDRVQVEVSPYDMSMGRIVFRMNSSHEHVARETNREDAPRRRKKPATESRYRERVEDE